MLRTLKQQLLAVFLSLSVVSASVIALNLYILRQKEALDEMSNNLTATKILLLDDFRIIADFFTYETVSSHYFETAQSACLDAHRSNRKEINALLEKTVRLNRNKAFHLNEIDHIESGLAKFDSAFDQIRTLILERGFKDYGVEGKMRQNIHNLENVPGINLTRVLTLRRHEKDYIIRNEEKYISKLNEASAQLRAELLAGNVPPTVPKDTLLAWLDNYVNGFNQIVQLDKRIGIKDNSALRRQIESQKSDILERFDSMLAGAAKRKVILERRLKTLMVGVYTLVVAIMLAFSFFFAKRLTHRLSQLSANMSAFVKNGFTELTRLDVRESDDEIGMLIANYRLMKKEIVGLVHEFMKKVEERTAEIVAQSERIQQQNEEIKAQWDELIIKNALIEEQKAKVEVQNKEILDSIRYAKRIQQALMPDPAMLKNGFNDSLLLMKPRDIVSGDFLYVKHIRNKNKNHTLIAAADCTGHGVPGAFMSVLGITFLNDIVTTCKGLSPAELLGNLRQRIIEALSQRGKGAQSHDGIDIAMCLFDHDEQKAHFAGANRPIIVVGRNGVERINGDKYPIGKHVKSDSPFTNIEIPYNQGDRFYLYSDGYVDQFGGPEKRKMKHKNFVELITQLQSFPLSAQHDMLEAHIETWKGDNKQTDDMLIVAVET